MSDKQDTAWEREKQLILESARRGFGHVEGISDTECLICALAARRRAYDDRVRERNEYRERAAKAEAERDIVLRRETETTWRYDAQLDALMAERDALRQRADTAEAALQAVVRDVRVMLREIYARDGYMSPELKAIHDRLARAALRKDEGGE